MINRNKTCKMIELDNENRVKYTMVILDVCRLGKLPASIFSIALVKFCPFGLVLWNRYLILEQRTSLNNKATINTKNLLSKPKILKGRMTKIIGLANEVKSRTQSWYLSFQNDLT